MRFLSSLAALVIAIPAFAEDGRIDLLVEEQRVVKVEGLKRVAIGDSSIADVKTIGGAEVLVIGASEGKTTLILMLQNGQQQEYAVAVRQGEREAATVEEVELEKGQLKAFKATGITGLEVGAPEVVEARLKGGRLQLRALSAGRCDLVLLRKSGPLKLVVEVTAPEGEPAVPHLLSEIQVMGSGELFVGGWLRPDTGSAAGFGPFGTWMLAVAVHGDERATGCSAKRCVAALASFHPPARDFSLSTERVTRVDSRTEPIRLEFPYFCHLISITMDGQNAATFRATLPPKYASPALASSCATAVKAGMVREFEGRVVNDRP